MISLNNKRNMHIISRCFILILLITLTALVSCNQNTDDNDYPDEKLISRIEKDYNEKYCLEDPRYFVFECYGIYNECIPVMMDGGYYTNIVTTQTIAGIDFTYYDGKVIEVWKKGEFYSLQEAYNQGYLDEKELRQIKEIYDQSPVKK
ncbi:MAG: hypothetical protein J6L83_06235 [Clostridia bacterium]|nr:hypothetical protein [Clostridia bacterium]